MATAAYPPPPNRTANPSPLRRPRSLRRTCSLDVAWPEGFFGKRLIHGRVRDLRTGDTLAESEVVAQATMECAIDGERVIAAISAHPHHEHLQQVVGQRAGSHLRLFIRETMPEMIAAADPLYLALDDMSGTSLVSNWALVHWTGNWMGGTRERISDAAVAKLVADRVNVCWGLAEGNSGLQQGVGDHRHDSAAGGELRNGDDPDGWHEFPVIAGPSFRRARRIDIWREDGSIEIETSFQDSAPSPQEKRFALHEYTLRLSVSAADGIIRRLAATPHILPFFECPGATANAQRVVGTPLAAIRDTVLANLRGTEGCTHLNDMLRALGDVPKLAENLE